MLSVVLAVALVASSSAYAAAAPKVKVTAYEMSK